MKKRILLNRLCVISLIVTMIFTGLGVSQWGLNLVYADTSLSGSGTSGDPYIISSSEQLAALGGQNLSGSYKLEADIDMDGVSMSPITSLEGDFDGNGKNISNLTLSGSKNVGLIGTLKSGTVENLELKNLSISATGNNVGGLIGNVSGAAEIKDITVRDGSVLTSGCAVGGLIGYISAGSSNLVNISTSKVTGSVKSTYSSASYGTGGLVGNIESNSKVNIDGCISLCDTEAVKYVGGFIGRVSQSIVNVKDSYAAGDVTATLTTQQYIYSAGFIGYVYGNSSNVTKAENSYFAGTISNGTTSTSYTDQFLYGSSTASYSLTNCFYNSDNATFTKTSAATGKTTEEMKAATFASDLGGAFEASEGNYPTLKWENPNATYSVKLKVSPVDSKVTFDEEAQEISKNGEYEFTGFSSGSKHTYKVEQASDATDLKTEEGAITIGKSDVVKNVTLTDNTYDMTFNVLPVNAKFSVSDGQGKALEPKSSEGGVYRYVVIGGDYTYTGEAFGYENKSDTVTINKGTLSTDVSLTEKSKKDVTFEFYFNGNKIDESQFTYDVKSGDNVATVTKGVVSLYDGEDYTYKIRSKAYKAVSGSATSNSGTIRIDLEEKVAWEGSDDISEPEVDDQGVYQISSGAELAWFAGLVNGTLETIKQNTSASAILTRDLDLGGYTWTPIASSSWPNYSGIFDGNGKEIKNLATDSTSSYQGLFGSTDSDAVIKNLTIKGTVSGKGYTGAVAGKNAGTIENVIVEADVNGSNNNVGGVSGDNSGNINSSLFKGKLNTSYYNAGGIAGNNKGTIYRCFNEGTVTSTYSTTSSSYGVGGIVGYDNNTSAGMVSISESANRGSVTAASMTNTGGIAGYVSGSTIKNVYNTGNVSGKSRTGGIIGYASNGKISQIYNGGNVTGSGSYSGEITGYLYNGTQEDIFYNSSNDNSNKATGYGTINATDGIDKIVGVGAFVADTQNQNEGMPIFDFEDTTPKFEVNLTLDPADVDLVVTNAEEVKMVPSLVKDGVATFKLPNGEYKYKASKFGKVTENGTFTVSDNGLNKTISLADAQLYSVTFDVTPSEIPDIIKTITFNGTTIEADAYGVYHLPDGEYEYLVKAKGYGKVKGKITVNGTDVNTKVTLQPTEAWDGETLDMPEVDEDGIYQISSGAELAWFAGLVNGTLTDGTKQNKEADAVLTDNIDLGNNEWVPIGNYSNMYAGNFSGNNHEISGIYINTSGTYKALFGYIKNATISGVTVSGTVNAETPDAAGLVARGEAFNIENCGNKVNVTNKNSTAYTAGILGQAYSSGTIKNCYNLGKIESTDRSSGIVADMSSGTVENCYNAGEIVGAKGIGIGAASSGVYKNCYNIGSVTGTTSAYSICASSYATYTNNFYLENSAANDSNVAQGTAMSSGDMKSESFITSLGVDNYKADSTGLTNNGYPVLKWQILTEPTEKNVKLDTPTNLKWVKAEPNEGDKSTLDTGISTTDDLEDSGNTQQTASILNQTTKVTWNTVTGASGYVLKLYRLQDYYNSVYIEKETPKPAYTSEIVTNSEFDFNDAIDNLDKSATGIYMFTVTAIGDGDFYLDSDESDLDGDGYEYYGNIHIDSPTGLSWNEETLDVSWNNNSKAEFYYLTLYKDSEKVDTFIIQDINSNDEEISLSLLREIKNSGKYYFTVQAGFYVKDKDSAFYGNAFLSGIAKSKEFTYTATTPEWVDISSASQWIELANVSAKGTEYKTDADAQYAAWSKNYRLSEDIDFSNLTATEKNKAISLGNINAEFCGTFDGNGHKIKGLTLSNGDSGLFAYIGEGGTVKNIVIDRANVMFSDNAATLCWVNHGSIKNSAVLNTNITADTGAIIGGMVSRNYGSVTDSYVQGGTLTARSSTANGHAGFVGCNYGSIKQCYTSMDVTTNSYCAGGFAGWADSYKEGTCEFVDCFALGNVSAVKGWSGGFIGRINSSDVTFANCYAANKVESSNKPDRAYGFVGALGSQAYNDDLGEGSGAFDITLSQDNFSKCYYNSDLTAIDNSGAYAVAKSDAEMKTLDFATLLGTSYAQDNAANNGLPYLKDIDVPKANETSEITVKMLIADYDLQKYEFATDTGIINVKIDSSGNTRVIDVMEAAQKQKQISYTYSVTAAYGSFIESINGKKLSAPNGWMFTVNDELSDVSASLKTVNDGDEILWYQGMTQNLFQGPTWDQMTGTASPEDYTIITSSQQLVDISKGDASALSGNYRLGKDLDMSGISFDGIGSKENPFTGKFDGDGHTITGLTISKDADSGGVGMFNFIQGAQIENLKLVKANVTGGYVVGALVGNAGVKVSSTSITENVGNKIRNCSVEGTVTGLNEKIDTGGYIGGLIGFNDGDIDSKSGISVYSSIDNCEVTTTVNSKAPYTGGLAGGNYGYITNSSSNAQVMGTTGVGGFVGGNNGGILNCSSDSIVKADSLVGGFAGLSTEKIENSYSKGKVIVTSENGDKIGGFVGSGSGILKKCISASEIIVNSSNSYVGGFAGMYEGTIVGLAKDIQLKDCYGYCLGEKGEEFNAIGNKTSSQVEAEQEVLNSMKLTSYNDVIEKVKEELGVDISPKTKVDPEYTLPTNLSATYGSTLSSIKLPDGYKWVSPTQSVGNVGTHSFKAIYTPDDTEKYNIIEVSISVKVIARTSSGIKVSLSTSTYTYNGKTKNPSVKVKLGNTTLKNGTDYTISKSKGRKKVGTYTYKITLKGNYTGTISKTFKINPKGTTIKKLSKGKKKITVKWSKKKTQVTGYQIRYSTKSSMKKAKTITVKNYKTTSKTISKLKSKKKYYVQIRTYKTVKGKKYYSKWSKKKSIKTK